MPIDQERPLPKIKVIFKGFVMTRIKDGNPVAEMGALTGSPCHSPRISVLKSGADGRPHTLENVIFDIDQNIELKVENTDSTGIREYRKPGFDRAAGVGDQNDFGWVVDLNNELFGGREFPIAPGKLKPIFRINNAEFYTELRTNGPMNLKRPGQQPQPFGRLAEHISANVYFDRADSKAVIRNGTNDLLTIDQAEPGATYLIVFDCHCQQELAVSDFPLVFEVLPGVPEQDRVDFVGEDRPGILAGDNGGDVPCGGGNMTRP